MGLALLGAAAGLKSEIHETIPEQLELPASDVTTDV
jgi:hypothetical protein